MTNASHARVNSILDNGKKLSFSRRVGYDGWKTAPCSAVRNFYEYVRGETLMIAEKKTCKDTKTEFESIQTLLAEPSRTTQ
jgi:hypothetical protein